MPREALRVLKGGNAALGDEEFAQFRGTQAALLRSRLVLNAALRNKDVSGLAVVREQTDPVGWLEKRLRIDFPEKGEVARVGMDGPRPEQLATLVNSVVDSYMQTIPDNLRKNENAMLRRLEEMYTRYGVAIRDKRRALQDLQVTGTLDQTILLQALNDCAHELRRIRLEKAAVETRRNRLRAPRRQNIGPVQDKLADLEEQVAILAAQEKVLQEEEKRTRADYAERLRQQDSPELEELRGEIHAALQLRTKVTEKIEQYRSRERTPPGITVLQRAQAPGAK
jgi:hypothetical protein